MLSVVIEITISIFTYLAIPVLLHSLPVRTIYQERTLISCPFPSPAVFPLSSSSPRFPYPLSLSLLWTLCQSDHVNLFLLRLLSYNWQVVEYESPPRCMPMHAHGIHFCKACRFFLTLYHPHSATHCHDTISSSLFIPHHYKNLYS